MVSLCPTRAVLLGVWCAWAACLATGHGTADDASVLPPNPNSPRPAENLLHNPGFELAPTGAEDWTTFSSRTGAVTFAADTDIVRSGKRAARVEAAGADLGSFQQIVRVKPGAVYVCSAWVRCRDLDRLQSQARVQVLFRGPNRRPVGMIDLPRHTGTLGWFCDSPACLKLQAPMTAVIAEINLCLFGPGTAWFDDVYFGPAPVGDIAGRVTSDGKPVAGVQVALHGTERTATTDEQGNYCLSGVPAALPRYLVIATKAGFAAAALGGLPVKPGETQQADLALRAGDNRFATNVRVVVASLRSVVRDGPRDIAEEAVIDPGLYPEAVRVYLQSAPGLDSSDPLVRAAAGEIIAGVPTVQRTAERAMTQAVYGWIVRNVESALTTLPDVRDQGLNYLDVTDGDWQMTSGVGWCWGRSFEDCLLSPGQILSYRTGTRVEHARLATALLRAVGIPARPIRPHQAQLWVQMPDGSGYWCSLNTAVGRAAYRTDGSLRVGIGALPATAVELWPLDAGGLADCEWQTDKPCLWRGETLSEAAYPDSPEGRAAAGADLAAFAKSGEDPQRARREALRHGRPASGVARAFSPPPGGRPRLVATYSGLTLNLTTIGDQRAVTLRFPLPTATLAGGADAPDYAYWTDRPTWLKQATAPPASSGARRWLSLEFDLTSLFAAK